MNSSYRNGTWVLWLCTQASQYKDLKYVFTTVLKKASRPKIQVEQKTHVKVFALKNENETFFLMCVISANLSRLIGAVV